MGIKLYKGLRKQLDFCNGSSKLWFRNVPDSSWNPATVWVSNNSKNYQDWEHFEKWFSHVCFFLKIIFLSPSSVWNLERKTHRESSTRSDYCCSWNKKRKIEIQSSVLRLLYFFLYWYWLMSSFWRLIFLPVFLYFDQKALKYIASCFDLERIKKLETSTRIVNCCCLKEK